MTHDYIGTKTIKATPMTRAAYSAYRGWDLPDNEDGSDKGYLVEYTDGGTPNDARHKGYISWSPQEAFCGAYRLSEGDVQALTFGDAIHFLKKGCRVTRTGWNGKGLWLEMQRPDAHSKMSLPYLFLSYPMPGPNGGDKVPWAPSQTDVLAEDWMVL